MYNRPSYWDASSNSWQFDYDSYYRAYPQAAAAAGAGAYNVGDLSQQASAYSYGGEAGADGSAAGGTGAAKQKKFVPGPKDEEGNAIAGKLKKGETRTTVLRKAAGKVWEDLSLLEWDPSEYGAL